MLGHDVVDEGDAVRSLVSRRARWRPSTRTSPGARTWSCSGGCWASAAAAPRTAATSCSTAFGLAEAAGRLVKHYSGGMRRRLDIAASIVVTPELMFLDEPTTGLDPRSRNQVWDIVHALVAGARRSCSAPSTSTRPTSWPTASP